jgi:RNA polymerase sigma factor (sigma-70 family)
MSMQANDDGVLVSQVREGNLEAYGELVRRYQGSVFGVCYRMLGGRQEAEDLAQDAFLRGYERLETFDLAYPFGPWIRRVAANLCLNRLQRRQPVLLEFDDEAGLRHRQANAGDSGREPGRADSGERPALPVSAVIELRHYGTPATVPPTLRLSSRREMPLSGCPDAGCKVDRP